MKFCSSCGASVRLCIPKGDNRQRHVCQDCGEIHYQNPKIVTGCIPRWEDKILLCKRAILPRSGFWTVPAGFMENGESSQQGAARETLEEATARVEISSLFTTFNLPHINQVYLLFLAELKDLEFSPGVESTDVQLFTEAEIPWDEIAFPVVTQSLKLFFADRGAGKFKHRTGDIVRLDGHRREYRTTIMDATENS
jgi:ADP-ribose pyrophosphatase YjhB (NUDIX family)